MLGLGLVLGPAYWVGNQAIVQRSFGVKSEADARASYVFAAVIKLVFPVLLVLPGLLAIALYADELGPPGAGYDANRVLPLMIERLVPPGALGLLTGAFVAGVMANLEAYVNSASTLIVTDLYRPFLRPGATDKECLRARAAALVVVMLVVGAIVSYQVKTRFRFGVRGVSDVSLVLSGRAVLAAALRHGDAAGRQPPAASLECSSASAAPRP